MYASAQIYWQILPIQGLQGLTIILCQYNNEKNNNNGLHKTNKLPATTSMILILPGS